MSDITRALNDLSAGRKDAAKDLFPLIYRELRAIAASYMRRERCGHTLVPTALVHEAYLKLINQTQIEWVDKRHFLATAALVMRRLLIDHARAKRASKRHKRAVPLDLAIDIGAPIRSLDALIDLDDALERLER